MSSLKLRLRLPTGSNKTIEVPSSATKRELDLAAAAAGNWKTNVKLSYLRGFPPQHFDCPDEASITAAGISTGETLIVKLADSPKAPPSTPAQASDGSNDATMASPLQSNSTPLQANASPHAEHSSSAPRPARASKTAARANIVQEIAAMEAAMALERSTSKGKQSAKKWGQGVALGSSSGAAATDSASAAQRTGGSGTTVDPDGAHRLTGLAAPSKRSNVSRRVTAMHAAQRTAAKAATTAAGKTVFNKKWAKLGHGHVLGDGTGAANGDSNEVVAAAASPTALSGAKRKRDDHNTDTGSSAAAALAGSGSASGVRGGGRGRGTMRMLSLGGSEESIAEKLAAAAAAGRGRGVGTGSGSGSGSAADTTIEFLRAASKRALAAQEEVTRANSRYAAALAGTYEMTPLASARTLGSGSSALLRVRWKRDRHWEEETVDNLDARALVQVLAMVGGSGDEGVHDSLKPHMMAQISPKQFWAFVRYGGAALRKKAASAAAHSAAAAADGADSSAAAAAAAAAVGPVSFDVNAPVPQGCPVALDKAYAALVPQVEWSFLASRARKASEKALANAAAAAAVAAEREVSRRRRLGLSDDAVDATVKQALGLANTDDVIIVDDSSAAGPASTPTSSQTQQAVKQLHPAKAVLDNLQICKAMLAGDVKFVSDDASLRALAEAVGLLHVATSSTSSPTSAAAIRSALIRIHSLLHDGAAPQSWDAVTSAWEPQALDGLLNALQEADAGSLAAPSGAADASPPEPTDGEETCTFICSKCEKSRIITASMADLEAIKANDDWSCDVSGISALLARGGCAAPDDDLANVLGSDTPAAAVEFLGFTSPEDVAAANIPDDDLMLFSGAEGPVPADYLISHALTEIASGLPLEVADLTSDSSPEPLPARWFKNLGTRIPPTQVLTMDRSHVAVKSDVYYLHAGFCLVVAAALAVVGLKADGDGLTAAQCLLRIPLGWAAAAAFARYWQSFARAQVMEELMARIVDSEGGGDEELTDEAAAPPDQQLSSTYLSVLDSLGIRTPLDLARMDPQQLLSAIRSQLQAAANGASASSATHEPPPAISAETVQRWHRRASELVEQEPWLNNCLTSLS